MTTIYEPCPVAWCERSGKHKFLDDVFPDMEHTRDCTRQEPTITGLVSAEVFTKADGTVMDPVVILDLDDTSHEVRSGYDMGVLINSMIRAAETAWPGFRAEFQKGLEFQPGWSR